MIKKMRVLFVALVCIFVLAACGSGVVLREDITTPITGNYSLTDVEKAIVLAGQQKKWVMKVIGSGVIRGAYSPRDHRVDIEIKYSTKSYTIKYVSSENMRATTDKINPHYMRWIHNLDKDIQIQLLKR